MQLKLFPLEVLFKCKVALLILMLIYVDTQATDRKEGQALADSLEQVLKKPGLSDREKVDVLSVLAYEYRNLMPSKAILLGGQAEKIAKQVHYEQKLAEIYYILAFAHNFYDDLIKSYEYSLLCLQYSREYKVDDILPIAKLSIMLTNPNITFDEYKKDLISLPSEIEKIKDMQWYIRTIGLLGHFYNSLDTKKSDSLLRLAVDLSRRHGFRMMESHNLSRLSDRYFIHKMYDSAIQISFQQIVYFESIGEKRILSESYGGNALLWLLKYEQDKRPDYLDSAAWNADSSVMISAQIGYKSQMLLGYLHKYRVEKYRGNSIEALKFLEKARELEQDLMGDSARKKLVGITIKQRDEVAEAQLKIKDAEVDRQRFYTFAGLGGLLLTGLLLFVVFRNYRSEQHAKRHIEAANRELKDTQAQLVQQEKLASLGALTAGIAHEIKNPLNFVNNFAELSNDLLDELKHAGTDTEKHEIMATLQQNLSKIREHGKRADEIVKSMLEHSRSGTAEMQLTDINKLCDEFLNLAYHGMRASTRDFNCTMDKKFADNLPKINVVQQDISRVLLNLINNAFYAIKDKADGVITVTTQTNNSAVLIKVKDNGTGVPDSVRQKIFEPFFTTKPSGSGTGLGLSLSFDIIKAHGGQIELQSEQGMGSEFIITLPLRETTTNNNQEKSI